MYTPLTPLGTANRSRWKQGFGLHIFRSCYFRIRHRRNFGSRSNIRHGMCTKRGAGEDQRCFPNHGYYWGHAVILD